VENKHIETVFRKPNILFNAIDAALERASTPVSATEELAGEGKADVEKEL